MNSLFTIQPVPQDVVDLSAQVYEDQERDDRSASHLTSLYARLCNLLAVEYKHSATFDQDSILARAIALDDDLVHWASNLPPSYEYESQPAPASAKAYSDYCDIYSSIFSAEVWNIYRSARMGANRLIVQRLPMLQCEGAEQSCLQGVDALSNGDELFSDLNVRLATLELLRTDICATIPFLLHRHGGQASPLTDLPLCSRTPVMHQLLFLMKSPGTSEYMSAWATRQLSELQDDVEVSKGAIWNAEIFDKRT